MHIVENKLTSSTDITDSHSSQILFAPHDTHGRRSALRISLLRKYVTKQLSQNTECQRKSRQEKSSGVTENDTDVSADHWITPTAVTDTRPLGPHTSHAA